MMTRYFAETRFLGIHEILKIALYNTYLYKNILCNIFDYLFISILLLSLRPRKIEGALQFDRKEIKSTSSVYFFLT